MYIYTYRERETYMPGISAVSPPMSAHPEAEHTHIYTYIYPSIYIYLSIYIIYI